MGEQTDRKLYFSVNGVDYTEIVGLQNIPDVTTAAEPVDHEFSLEGCSIEFHIKKPKILRCRNRKRFAKLLMSIGVPPNVARKIRAEKGQSYAALWWYVAMTNLCCCP